MTEFDRHHRPLRNLRLSVTDRCNLRCAYCMPDEEYRWLPKADILDFDEISRLVDVFLELGVDKVRLTGGEPLLRRELPRLIERLATKPGLRDLALTTNGVLLAPLANDLARAGLKRITISLDTLRRERFVALSKRDDLDAVLSGIAAARGAGFESVKLDTVLLSGVNDDEIVDLLAYAKEIGAELRFIEYMDVPGAIEWAWSKVVKKGEILARVESRLGTATPVQPRDDIEAAAPAERFALPDGSTFGIIASTTQPFCGACDRARLTADGTWYLCLYARFGIDLKAPLRAGASRAELVAILREAWRSRDDRGAERQLALRDARKSAWADERANDPRLEMHTRGG
jgi:cyclic pyranopterin phosphate synthase